MVTLNIMESKSAKKSSYPKSIAFIITNEFCERFSYYGMRAILALYLRFKLGYTDDGATIIYHMFTMFAYFFPVLGAMLADGWLGKYKTILYLSMVYACGSTLISLTAMPPLNLPQSALTILALLLIAFGTGGIKPCVSAFGGDQFKLPEQERFLGYYFSLFYFAINAGSLISTFLTPVLRSDVKCFGDDDCYSLAFGVPGVLMILSILFFVAGKRFYKIKNPTGNILGNVSACIGHAVIKSCKSKEKKEHWLDHADDKYERSLIEDIKSLLRVLVLFVPLPMFWALFDQQIEEVSIEGVSNSKVSISVEGSRWTFQGNRMRQDIGSWTLKADQMQMQNPLLILILIPLFEVAIYPFMYWCKLIRKPLHKMIWGGVFAATAFVISGIVELNLLPTYGSPVTAGHAQLRVYNGYDCELVLKANDYLGNATIQPLSMYQNLEIEATDYINLPYSLQGSSNSSCPTLSYEGVFHLKEKTANSFFVNNEGVYNFTDDNEKALKGVNVRFLVNAQNTVQVKLLNAKQNVTMYNELSNFRQQSTVDQGVYDLIVDGHTVIADYSLRVGAVYTINVFEDDNGTFSASVVMITPPNTVHILWLMPQYIIMTMGEVMFSVTGLEFSFTQAPISMKSVLQSVWLLTVAFGNLLVILIVQGNFLDAQWKEFFLFAGLMMAATLVFMVMAFRYKYVQQTDSEENAPEEIRLPEKQTVDKQN